MANLEFYAVSKSYSDGVWAVRDVCFTVRAGQLTTLLGPSGSGKSTLLRIAAGLESATAGAVYVDGRDVAAMAAQERSITLLFQGDSLFPHLNVLENVAFGLRRMGNSFERAAERALAALAMVGLADTHQRGCHELSGGQQQRVALARALALEPSVVLLDEPLSNLDDRLRRKMREEIRSLQRRLGITMAYVTHDESEAMAVSDQVVIINEGRVLQAGTPREVYERPNGEFVARFMGEGAVFETKVDLDGTVRIAALPLPALSGAHAPGTELRVFVRPEAWRILPVGAAEGIPARIKRCSYLGHGAEYDIECDLGTVLATMRPVHVLHQAGAPINLSLGAQGVSILSSAVPASKPDTDQRRRLQEPATSSS